MKSLVVAMHMMMKITSSAKVAVLWESTSELVDSGRIADGVFGFVMFRRQKLDSCHVTLSDTSWNTQAYVVAWIVDLIKSI